MKVCVASHPTAKQTSHRVLHAGLAVSDVVVLSLELLYNDFPFRGMLDGKTIDSRLPEHKPKRSSRHLHPEANVGAFWTNQRKSRFALS
jgi:hypothetical protein